MGSDSESTDEDGRPKISKNASPAAVSEAAQPREELAPGEEQVTPEGSGKNSRGKKKKREEKGGEGEEDVSAKRRASRERKSVERYEPATMRRTSATKALEIVQGSGEKLKDIPNVAFKLSKRKGDENLHTLHKIIFGRKATVQYLKKNILQFSGLAWSQDENKHMSKVKEKLSKCNKDRLLDFCNLLDIYDVKAATKKEEILAKLLEFLGSPHVTRDVLLSERDKRGRKQRRGSGVSGQPELGKTSSEKEKKRRKRSVVGADEHENTDEEETGVSVKSHSEDKKDRRKENVSTKKKLSDDEETDEGEEPESVSCKKSRKEEAVHTMESKYYSRRYASKKAEPMSGSRPTNRSATIYDKKKGNENISMKSEDREDENEQDEEPSDTGEPVKSCTEDAEDENKERDSTKRLSDGEEEINEHEEPLFKEKSSASGWNPPAKSRDSKSSAPKKADTGSDNKVTSKPGKQKAEIRKESKDDSKANVLLKKAERRPYSHSSSRSTKNDKKKGKVNDIPTMEGDEEDQNEAEDEGASHKEAAYGAEDEEDEIEETESTKKLSNDEEAGVHEEAEFKEKSLASESISGMKSRKGSKSSFPKKAATGHDTKVTSKHREDKAAIRKDSKDKSKTGASNQITEPRDYSHSSNRSTSKGDKNKGKIRENIVAKNDRESKKQVAKKKSKVAGKKQGEDEDVSVGPSREQVYAVVARLIKEVDIEVVTLREIIGQVGSHFNVDLMDRRDEIKGMIAEVLQNMTDDEEAEDSDGDGDDNVGADEGGGK
ncbi:omega-hydroxypalmitate O-feruloyl transferase [Apostasia shenzhenica]|uniref:Omega-hydroxypalmitate O-feruloyl transferase n=1 Tax=Apostasia shenzhenica TaxID=1088818 RepID=A0A2I0AGZ0_9ASPA|nr:omega-hydroxypalmitate O-feruloyl transferase [Apostasia shenzhenica]